MACIYMTWKLCRLKPKPGRLTLSVTHCILLRKEEELNWFGIDTSTALSFEFPGFHWHVS